jgi:hypothetical protein
MLQHTTSLMHFVLYYPIPPPRALTQLKSRWPLSRVQSVLVGSKKRSLPHEFKGNFALSIARNLPAGLQFTHGTRILLSRDVLCAMPSHSVSHVLPTLQLNSSERSSFEVRESQRGVHLGNLVF